MPEQALTVLEQLYDGVYVTDAHRRIVFWNNAAEKITGFSRDDVLHRCCGANILNHCDAHGRCLCTGGCPLAASMADGEPRETALYLRHRDGHRVPVRVRVAPLFERDGTVTGAVEVFSDDTRHVERARELARLALLDPLTGLPNRRCLEMRVQSRLSDLGRQRTPLAVLVADVDDLKSINERHGRAAGDRVLGIVARTLRGAAHALDAVGRWGNDEFVGLVAAGHAADLSAVGRDLAQICAQATLPVGGEQVPVRVSIGLAGADLLDDLPRLMAKAWQAMRMAREAGGSRGEVYTEIPPCAVRAG